MILQKITSENINRLNYFDTIYKLGRPCDNTNDKPEISQILSFSEGESKFDLLDGNFYFSNKVWYHYD